LNSTEFQDEIDMAASEVGNGKLRSFGLILGACFAVIALWPAVFRSESPRTWALGLAVLLSGTALVYPPALRSFHRWWMSVGEALGWVNSRIILGIVYYVLIIPIGVIRRITGSDPMRRNFESHASTYKIARSRRPPSHMQRQF
jgi:hypothetical protein